MTARPKRGTPEQTRARLVSAAARVFNRKGYESTDSNKLARAAGYSTGVFYKHFADKRALFLAVYAEWVASEYDAFARALEGQVERQERARAVVAALLDHHTRWRRFRATLRVLVASDALVRRFHHARRAEQLDALAAMRPRPGASREADAWLMLALERVADALADGEAKALGVDPLALTELLVAQVELRV